MKIKIVIIILLFPITLFAFCNHKYTINEDYTQLKESQLNGKAKSVLRYYFPIENADTNNYVFRNLYLYNVDGSINQAEFRYRYLTKIDIERILIYFENTNQLEYKELFSNNLDTPVNTVERNFKYQWKNKYNYLIIGDKKDSTEIILDKNFKKTKSIVSGPSAKTVSTFEYKYKDGYLNEYLEYSSTIEKESELLLFESVMITEFKIFDKFNNPTQAIVTEKTIDKKSGGTTEFKTRVNIYYEYYE